MKADALVVGGGIAGLTTALGLADSGLKVVVLEADARLGGRARSWTDPTTQDVVSIGPHILLNHYPNLFALLRRLGTMDEVVWQPEGRLITLVDAGKAYPLDLSPLPAPLHFASAVVQDPTIGVLDIASNWAVVRRALAATEAEVLALDDESGLEFLRRMGVSQPIIDRFWAFACMAIMNVPLEHCSAGALLRFFQRVIGHRDASIGFPRAGLGDLFTPAQGALERAGSALRLGSRVVELLADERKVSGVRLDSGERLEAPVVVVTLPPQQLLALAHPRWRDEVPAFADLEHFEPVPYVSLYLWFDRKVTTMQFWARTGDGLNCDFYDLSNINPDWRGRSSLITSNIIYAHRAATMSDEALVRETLHELTEALPEVRAARLEHHAVHRIPMAVHAPRPGTERRRPDQRTPVEGLFLAGDWTKTGLPASMESAAASGWLAAEAALAARGIAKKLFQPLPPLDATVAVFAPTAPDASAALGKDLFTQATRDPTTQLYNRRFLEELLAREVALARRWGSPLAALSVRIEPSASTVARLEEVMKEAADALRVQVRLADLLARVSTTQLLLVVPGASPVDADAILGKLEQALATKKTTGGALASVPTKVTAYSLAPGQNAHALLASITEG